MNGAPEYIEIEHDDYVAKYVGRTPDGRQFFLTEPFVPATSAEQGREFLALYLFDQSGKLLNAEIRDLGTRGNVADSGCQETRDGLLTSLGTTEFARIRVKPFEVERFGVSFGLIPREPEDEDDEWAVEAQPGNYMAFFEPFDSGEYDT
ncbi:MAG: hypothetical protein ACR2IE_01840 [Candidatus Sumerlaeaceae bacterium]